MPHHVATELEILQRHLDDGDEVAVLACNGDLPACLHKMDDRESKRRLKCSECVTGRSAGLGMLDQAFPIHVLDNYYSDADRAKEQSLRTRFESADEIREYQEEDFDIGYAALSSTVFLVRDAYLEKPSSKELLSRMVVASFRTYCSVSEFLKQHTNFDRAYVFNGRFATCRGAFRACQHAGLEVHLHERGSDNSKFMIYENGLPHDLANMEKRIRECWGKASETERAAGQGFYEQRRARVESLWHSHTKAQVQGRLPASWDHSKRNIVVYTSSDDEYVAIGPEWVAPGFESQTQAILNLCERLRNDPNTMLYVRLHPHLRNVDNQDTRRLRSLSGSGVEVIPSDSEICSYALLDGSEKIVTFGSTLGVEATYWRKPSVLAGMSFYRSLDACYVAGSDQELLELVSAKLEPKPMEPALMYGLYMSSFGEPFRYYEAENFETGKFRGRPLRNAIPYSLFGAIVPQITRSFGQRPRQFKLIERLAYTTCYKPFLLLYDLVMPIRNAWRKRALN